MPTLSFRNFYGREQISILYREPTRDERKYTRLVEITEEDAKLPLEVLRRLFPKPKEIKNG